jgi:hypothetical protein
MNRAGVMVGTDTFTDFDQAIAKDRNTKATETTMNGFRLETMSSRQDEANMGESYPCVSAKCTIHRPKGRDNRRMESRVQ